MGQVIDFYVYKSERERLGAVRPRTYLRRSRPRRGEGSKTPAAGSDLSAELRNLLLRSLVE